MSLECTPSGQACGAHVRGVDLRADLDADTVQEIRQLWLEHHVLAFPDQGLTDDDLERFTQYFGPFGNDPYLVGLDDHPHVVAVHRAADETAPIFADSWHADWTFQATPPDGTCLYSIVVPPEGGDTLYSNQRAALAAMPADLRARVEGAVAIHSAKAGYAPDGLYGSETAGQRATKIRISDEAYATQTHPLVRTHPETGVPSLYGCLGYIIGIDGLSEDAGVELLLDVYHWQTREEFRYTHSWEPGMLVLWDNRCVLHRATGGYDGHERLLHRTTIGFNEAAVA